MNEDSRVYTRYTRRKEENCSKVLSDPPRSPNASTP